MSHDVVRTEPCAEDPIANLAFDSIEVAIETIARGGLVIVTDDEDRENEGDLIFAAEKATVEAVNFMIRHARGLICVPMTAPHLRRLGIGEMVPRNRESFQTAFAVSVDAAEGITTGISAFDRYQTIRLLADQGTTPEQLVQPGHIFPLYARPGGVLERAGHTEAAVDLVTLAGLTPSAVICEILKDDGDMARLPDLQLFKKQFNLPLISIAQLIDYRRRREHLIEEVSCRPVSTPWGTFDLRVFRERLNGREHLALSMGVLDEKPTLVRVHTMNVVSDVFHAAGPEGARSIDFALQKIAEAGRGVFVYLDSKHPSTPAAVQPGSAKQTGTCGEFREYGTGAQILKALGLRHIRLLSGRTRKIIGLEGFGIDIVEQLPF